MVKTRHPINKNPALEKKLKTFTGKLHNLFKLLYIPFPAYKATEVMGQVSLFALTFGGWGLITLSLISSVSRSQAQAVLTTLTAHSVPLVVTYLVGFYCLFTYLYARKDTIQYARKDSPDVIPGGTKEKLALWRVTATLPVALGGIVSVMFPEMVLSIPLTFIVIPALYFFGYTFIEYLLVGGTDYSYTSAGARIALTLLVTYVLSAVNVLFDVAILNIGFTMFMMFYTGGWVNALIEEDYVYRDVSLNPLRWIVMTTLVPMSATGAYVVGIVSSTILFGIYVVTLAVMVLFTVLRQIDVMKTGRYSQYHAQYDSNFGGTNKMKAVTLQSGLPLVNSKDHYRTLIEESPADIRELIPSPFIGETKTSNQEEFAQTVKEFDAGLRDVKARKDELNEEATIALNKLLTRTSGLLRAWRDAEKHESRYRH